MAGTDLALDPRMHDILEDDAGDFVETVTLEPAIQHQVLDQRGAFFADMEAGSGLHLLPRKADRGTLLRREDAVREALQVFVALGLAEDLRVETDVDQYGRPTWMGALTDVQSGRLDLTPLISVGVGQEG